MKDNGSTIRPMEMALIRILTEPNILETGKMINRTESGLKNGWMEKSMRVNIRMGQKLARES